MVTTTWWVWPGIFTGVFWGTVALAMYTPWGKQKSWYARIAVPIQQFAFNFVCGLAGWYCLYLFTSEYYKSSGASLAILLIALAGISGRLAHVMWILPDIARGWVDKHLEKYLK